MRSSSCQRLHEGLVIVGRAVLPAGKQNSNPLIRQGSHCCLMRFTALAHALIIAFGPFAPDNRASREFVKSLPDEFRAGKTPMYPAALTAPLGDRCDARECLYLGGRYPSLPIHAKHGQQAWG